MNKKRMKWIFFILILTCFPVVLVYANGAPMPGANNFNTNTPAPNTGTGAPQPGANGYITNSNSNITPKQSNGYAPPNVQEAKTREAQQQKNKQDKKKKDEKKIEKDDDYQSIQKKAENVDKTLKNKNASTKDIKKAGEDIEDIMHDILG